MIKWFAYIVLLLILAPGLSSARNNTAHYMLFERISLNNPVPNIALTDTTSKNTKTDDKKKVKELGKARRQPKPEKIVTTTDAPAKPKPKPKRQRRPEGLERPPEIPRRNGGG